MNASSRFDSSVELSTRLTEVLLPFGGVLVALVEAYFDESGSHDGSPVLCVAGYIVEASQARLMDAEWRAVLAKWNVPYFRMSQCAHGNGPFEILARGDRIQLVANLIAVIKRRVIEGVAVTVNPAEYYEVFGSHADAAGGPYTGCVRLCFGGVQKWLEDNRYAGDVAYFFESGHRHQGETNLAVTRYFALPDTKAKYGYAGHTFADKMKVPILQAADLLAWQWFTDAKHERAGKLRRRDCDSLMQQVTHFIVHMDRESLSLLAERIADAERQGIKLEDGVR